MIEAVLIINCIVTLILVFVFTQTATKQSLQNATDGFKECTRLARENSMRITSAYTDITQINKNQRNNNVKTDLIIKKMGCEFVGEEIVTSMTVKPAHLVEIKNETKSKKKTSAKKTTRKS